MITMPRLPVPDYNTPLTADQQVQYSAWGASRKRSTGRDPRQDTEDYDMQGYFAKNGGVPSSDPRGHYTDEFKKPNHPTFSTESQYSTVLQPGGEWTSNGAFYQPSQQMTPTPEAAAALIRYMRRAEPATRVIPAGSHVGDVIRAFSAKTR